VRFRGGKSPIKLSCLAFLLFALTSPGATNSPPIVAQVHVLSIHVQDRFVFDEVYLFLRDVLKLPLVYGELSKPGTNSDRFYSGFSVGNAYLEPCGPYQTDAPFSADQKARFHGLTFNPASSILLSEQGLTARAMLHTDLVGGGDIPRFVYLNDPLITGGKQAVSIWEIQNQQDRVNLDFLRSSLRDSRGGALGITRLKEIHLAVPDEKSLTQWRAFLKPNEIRGHACAVGSGPVLRFVRGKESRVESIVFQVEHISTAKTFLAQRNLLGKARRGSIELDPAKIWGLHVILVEK
jgi:hypothetical protein